MSVNSVAEKPGYSRTRRIGSANPRWTLCRYSDTEAPFSTRRLGDLSDALQGLNDGSVDVDHRGRRETGAVRYTYHVVGRSVRKRRRNSWVFRPAHISS